MIFILLLVVGAFALGAILGAPYVPVLKPQIEPVLKALNLKPGQTLIDLGCGDGRLLKAAAKQGVNGIGYEINPWLYVIAKLNCAKYRNIRIKFGNYWTAKLPEADAVFVFLIKHYMSRLDEFLSAQIKKPTKVLSYIYAIPTRRPAKKGSNYYLYTYA